MPATTSARQETSENSNHNGGTIPSMIRECSERDPRPSRNRRSAQLPRRGSEPHGGSQSAVPATNSAHGGSQSTAPATQSAHGGSQSAAPATKSAHGGSHSAVPATKSAHGSSQRAAPATKSAHGGSQSAAPATSTGARAIETRADWS